MTDDMDIDKSQDPEIGASETGGEAEAAPVDEMPESEASQEASPDEDQFKVVNDGDANEDDAEAAMMAMLADLPEEASGSSADDINFGSAPVSSVEFQQLQQPAGRSEARNIDLLMDVDLPVSIELGRTKMPISDILALGPGSVVELNKLAGEPVDLLINSKVVAKGEVVVVDENFGLRITQLMTPEERLKALAND